MFTIRFTRNGQKDCTQVHAEINTDLPVDARVFVMKSERSNQISAELLRKYLENEYHNLIEKAHREAYEQGFKDGRQHKRKRTWFRRHFCEGNLTPCA